jgi:hypothetical protein
MGFEMRRALPEVVGSAATGAGAVLAEAAVAAAETTTTTVHGTHHLCLGCCCCCYYYYCWCCCIGLGCCSYLERWYSLDRLVVGAEEVGSLEEAAVVVAAAAV